MTTRKKAAADLAAAAPALDLGAAGGEATTGGAGEDTLAVAADGDDENDLTSGVSLRAWRPSPFVGAPVLYGEANGRKFGGQDVTAAIVTQVHSDTEVNLYVLPNSHAEPVFVANVALDPQVDGEAQPKRFWRYPAPIALDAVD